MLGFLKAIFKNKTLLWTLTKNDFKQKYFGNLLGVAWAFILPAATIGILWFVFQVGFKSKPVGNFPFILWLVSGMFPWFYFSEGLTVGSNSIIANGFLVKKVVFRISLLPIVSLSTVLIVHIFFVFVMFGMFIYYGYTPEIYWIQILYYIFASTVLLLGLSWLTASIMVFFKDMGQIIAIFIQFGFWGTPIFWSLTMVPEKYHWLIKINPVHYIVKGYRDSMINHEWFWYDQRLTLYFWVVTLIIFVIGGLTFKRLKPHFADVL